MRKKCARCAVAFDPQEEWWAICGPGENDCWSAVDGGDPIWIRLGKLINSDWTPEMEKEVADCPAWQGLMKDLIRAMDFNERLNLGRWIQRTLE